MNETPRFDAPLPDEPGTDLVRIAQRWQRGTLGIPRAVRLSDDGQRAVYLGSPDPARSGALQLMQWRVGATPVVIGEPAAASDAPVNALDAARRERLRDAATGITAFHADALLKHLVVCTGGRVWVHELATATWSAIPGSSTPYDALISPHGHTAVWLQDGCIMGATRGAADWTEAYVVARAASDTVQVGVADFIAAEEFDRIEGMWWSPGGRWLLYAEVDESPVDTYPLGERLLRYPRPGRPNAVVRLFAVDPTDPTTARELPWAAAGRSATGITPEYLTRVVWTPEGLQTCGLSRDQRTATITTWDVAEDDEPLARSTAVVTDPAWVHLAHGTPNRLGDKVAHIAPAAAEAGDRTPAVYRLHLDGVPVGPAGASAFITDRTHDRGILTVTDGDRTLLWLVAPDGACSPLTPAGAPMATVMAVSPTAVLIRVETADAWHSRIELLPLPATADHPTTLAGAVEFPVAHVYEPPTPPINRIDIDLPDLDGYGPWPRKAITIWPRAAAASGATRLPMLLMPYGGPHGQRVWYHNRALIEAQWWADQGFAVVIADGPGTPGGPAWERAMAGVFAAPAAAGQLAARRAALAAFPDRIDPRPAAVMGWSFGGYLSALLALRHPDEIAVAIAGAPVTDWALYDTGYTERYLGTPQEHPRRFGAESLTDDAPQVQRPILFIHGDADDNVLPDHSRVMLARLRAAGHPCGFISLGARGHMGTGAHSLRIAQLEFVRKGLAEQW